MRVVRFVLRLFGWLLTPFVAWAASYLGASLGATLTTGMVVARHALYVSIALGALTAVIAAALWIKLLHRSPELRSALAVTEDGTPVVALADHGETEKAG